MELTIKQFIILCIFANAVSIILGGAIVFLMIEEHLRYIIHTSVLDALNVKRKVKKSNDEYKYR